MTGTVEIGAVSDALTVAVISGFAGLVGAILSYIGFQQQIKRNLEAKYDSSLRQLRLEAYRKLWADLKVLALFGRAGYPGKDQLDELAEILKTWYFDEGGLYMSEKTRDGYFRLQRALRTLRESRHWQEAGLSELDPDTFEHLRRIGSRLRTFLTLDVGTRNPFSFDVKAAQEDAAGPSVGDLADPDEGRIAREWPAADGRASSRLAGR